MRKNKDKSEQNKEQVLKSTRNLQKKQKTQRNMAKKQRNMQNMHTDFENNSKNQPKTEKPVKRTHKIKTTTCKTNSN